MVGALGRVIFIVTERPDFFFALFYWTLKYEQLQLALAGELGATAAAESFPLASSTRRTAELGPIRSWKSLALDESDELVIHDDLDGGYVGSHSKASADSIDESKTVSLRKEPQCYV